MTLGEKIKKARLEKRLTQNQLAEDKITRNMLSAIESNKATPSLDTLTHLANRLSLPISYLLSPDDDLFFHKKNESIKKIKEAYENKDHRLCIDYILNIGETDDELELMLAISYFELARRAILGGALFSGGKLLSLAVESCKKTIYDTSRIETLALMYSALVENIQSPLLEFDANLFFERIDKGYDYDFYKYIIQDTTYRHSNQIFALHVRARELMKDRKYKEALALMQEIESEKKQNHYNAYAVFGVYTDMETCYKQLADFENAYRYASKRISLIEGFKT